jgi:hypothetical protein
MDKKLTDMLIEYVQVNEDIRAGLLQKVASLESDLNSQKAELTKTAAAAFVFPKDRIERTVVQLVTAGALAGTEKEAAITRMTSDPVFALDCLDKLAEIENGRRSQLKPMGRPVEVLEQGAARPESDKVWEDGINLLRRYQ